jgi:hypothetical protein
MVHFQIIFRHPVGVNPIPEGNILGQMSREYSKFSITEFVSAGILTSLNIYIYQFFILGAKQYAMEMKHLETGEIRHVLKIRGITLNHSNSQKIQYADFKRLILNNYEDEIEIDTSQIRPTPESHVRTYHSKKIYRPYCQKGIIDKHLNLIPFGFKKE